MRDDLTAALDEVLTLGQNGGMPTRRELPDLTSNAGRAHEAITGRARVAVLRFLLSEPHSTRPQIVEATGVSAGGVRSALLELEALGYVTSDAPAPRHGRRVFYSANRADLTDDLTAFVAWMLR